jgi:hypothetical protein
MKKSRSITGKNNQKPYRSRAFFIDSQSLFLASFSRFADELDEQKNGVDDVHFFTLALTFI